MPGHTYNRRAPRPPERCPLVLPGCRAQLGALCCGKRRSNPHARQAAGRRPGQRVHAPLRVARGAAQGGALPRRRGGESGRGRGGCGTGRGLPGAVRRGAQRRHAHLRRQHGRPGASAPPALRASGPAQPARCAPAAGAARTTVRAAPSSVRRRPACVTRAVPAALLPVVGAARWRGGGGGRGASERARTRVAGGAGGGALAAAGAHAGRPGDRRVRRRHARVDAPAAVPGAHGAGLPFPPLPCPRITRGPVCSTPRPPPAVALRRAGRPGARGPPRRPSCHPACLPVPAEAACSAGRPALTARPVAALSQPHTTHDRALGR